MIPTKRAYALLKSGHSLTKTKTNGLIKKKPVIDVHPTIPVRTRFAPSPTGFLHMGSLRTALYNYLLAKNTGGKFLLRLEDTDQKRLVQGAEQNIYDSLKWLKMEYDEGPGVNDKGSMGPYRQSERSGIYSKYIKELLDNGHAYRCFCHKDRLDGLRESAQKLQPPTTVSYDRHCINLSSEQVEENIQNGQEFTIRLKSPSEYPSFDDLLHGTLNIQPQINYNDVRYDDPILMKSDGLPTYHFANVVDDHLMEITHVIRGEEWLPSTPKHKALYDAFGWKSPKFIHIPLLTSTDDKKLSKRKGDASVLAMKEKGVLPEALLNFSALFGWSPPRHVSAETHDCFTLDELVKYFNINSLTKGNAKVDEKKLWFLNKYHLHQKLNNLESFEEVVSEIHEMTNGKYERSRIAVVLQHVGKSLTTVKEFPSMYYYFFEKPNYESDPVKSFQQEHDLKNVERVLNDLPLVSPQNCLEEIGNLAGKLDLPKKLIFETLRFALAGSLSGVKLPVLIELLGEEETTQRIANGIKHIRVITKEL